MEMGRLNAVVVVFLVAVGVLGMSSNAQKTHVVLGSQGWSIPSAGPSAYTTWAASETFTVGDILVFNFTTLQHTTAEVTKAAFDACTTTNPISLWTTGPASVTLNSSGEHYYLCTIPSHCTLGQKLAINVSAAASAAPPAPTPKPAPKPSTPPPAPTPSPTTTPTPAPTPSPKTPSPAPAPTPKTPSPAPAPTPKTPSPAPAPTPSAPTRPPSPSPAGGPPAPGVPTTSPPPAGGSTSPPPPSGSSATFAAAALPVTFLSVAMALFY